MIVIGTTVTTFAMLDPDRSFLWDAWLRNAEKVMKSHPEGVQYFAAIEFDSRGIEPFYPLTDRLLELGGAWWTYSLSDGRRDVTQANRLGHINMGQNLVSTYASDRRDCTHLLHMAADCEPPPNVLPKLLEVDNGIAAAECSTYCMIADPIPGYPFPVTGPPMTAVCVLIQRSVFKRLRWRYDPDENTTDDPSYTHDAETLLGVKTLIRKDCIATHHPEAISSIETRFPGLDMSVPGPGVPPSDGVDHSSSRQA